MKQFFKKFILIFIGFLTLAPISVLAITGNIYFSPSTFEIQTGDIFEIDLRIFSPDNVINSVEGNIIFDNEKLEVKEIGTGGSLFTLWAKTPQFSNEKREISFVGGTPNGFQGENALILKIFFLAKKEGDAYLDFKDNTLFFLHDGKGTPINPWLRRLDLKITKKPEGAVSKNEWQTLINSDKNPPEPFEIVLGKDPAIFNNQYFISFSTADKESGIDHYEVKEGERDFIKAESPYLLKDQSLKSLIKVKAVDKAGNERIEELMPAAPVAPFYKNILFWIAVFVIIALILFYVYWKKLGQKSKTNNGN